MEDPAAAPIRKRSGWLIPLAVFIVTAGLSALFLVYYLAPPPSALVEQQPSPTASASVVNLSVHGLKLAVPANYFVYSAARRGGAETDVALYALLPDLRGYTDAEAQNFLSNATDSPVVYLLIRDVHFNLSESERLKRIYLNYVTDTAGTPGPSGLTQYTFRGDSGYRNEDLFVGDTPKGIAIFRCVRFSDNVPSPSCLRDQPLAHGVALSYRFKRVHLEQWHEISDGVDALVLSFISRAK